MIAKVYSAIPYGFDGRIVTVEGDTSKNLPCFNIVGLATKTIFEARERVRSAINNSGFSFPARRVTVNLAPAELTKDGTHLDLPIALTVLAISGQLPQSCLEKSVFIAELSLSGALKPVRGIINAVETAQKAGFKTAYVAPANLSQAHLIPDIEIVACSDLTEVYLRLQGQSLPPTVVKNTQTDKNPSSLLPEQNVVKNTETDKSIPPSLVSANVVKTTDTDTPQSIVQNNYTDSTSVHLDQIHGQSLAKRGLIIALAGRHNLLFTGPPGTGKTLLARAAPNLLPPLSPAEQVEVTKIHSLTSDQTEIITKRPFRAPHHTASTTALLGGGVSAQIGEISLAHRGVLFLDEMPEFPRNVLESLRQPLEDRTITISRAHFRARYPADFTLIGTMNPCPCGHFGDPDHPCTCTESQIQAYHKRISGPILDRIDLVIPLQRLKHHEFLHSDNNPSSSEDVVKNTISLALQRQTARYASTTKTNASLSSAECEQLLPLSTPASKLLKSALSTFHLSPRSYYKIIKVARTIADLAEQPAILPEHISEALAFRTNPLEH